MDLSKVFVDRPIFAAVLSLFVFIAGLVAIPNLPISEYPEVVPPSVQVMASYPGADPQTISETVAAPLEDEINGVENMLYMMSKCENNGIYTLTIPFAVGTDPDIALVKVQNRVQLATPRLPADVARQGVTVSIEFSDFLGLLIENYPVNIRELVALSIHHPVIWISNKTVRRICFVLLIYPGPQTRIIGIVLSIC